LNNILLFLNQGWVGAAIGLISLVVAISLYRSSKIGPRLVYQCKSMKIIGRTENTPEEIEIFYQGRNVPRLLKTHMVIWNSGKNTVEGKSIVKGDLLRIEFNEEEEIIRAAKIRSTRDVNNFMIYINEESKNSLICTFEFLDPGDGVTIEILHTDIERMPDVRGTIKGMPNGIINLGSSKKGNKSKSHFLKASDMIIDFMVTRKVNWIFAIFGVIMMSIGTYIYYVYNVTGSYLLGVEKFTKIDLVMFYLIGILYSQFGIFRLWTRRRRFPKDLIFDEQDNELNYTDKQKNAL
jgi:hypothetical protein